MKVWMLIEAAEVGFLEHRFELDIDGRLDIPSPGHLAEEIPAHFKGICEVEASAEEESLKLVFVLNPKPDTIRARIFLICFESFLTTLIQRIWK